MQQITDAAGNIPYTISAHWNIVSRLRKRYNLFKTAQIVLTALSTGGFLASIIAGISGLSWLGGLTSAIALGLNLYMLNFNLPENIKGHTDAANELWDAREAYKSLLTDIEDLELEQIRIRREELTEMVSEINKKYPPTDEKSFKQAQANIERYTFEDGEAAKLLHVDYPQSHD